MAQWLMVYCRKDVPPLKGDQLTAALDEADLYILGELFDLEEDVIDAVKAQLQVKQGQNSGNTFVLDVLYQAKGRPISVWKFDPKAAQDQVREMLEEISPKSQDPGALKVREHLSQTRSVVGLELGLTQMDTVAEVLALVIGYWVAEQWDGLVDFYGNEWYSPEDRANPVWVPEERASTGE